MVKRQLAYLNKTRLVSIKHFKKWKLEQTSYNFRIYHNQDKNQVYTSNTHSFSNKNTKIASFSMRM